LNIISFVYSAANFTFGAVENVSAEAWTKILNVNVRGYALMAKAVVPFLKKQRSGSIIQMASVSSWIAQPEFVPYSTTKGAILQMTRNLALDLGPFNIRCNSICPGGIITAATAKHAANLNISVDELIKTRAKDNCLKRWGTTTEIANLTVFLASDLCHFATGASFLVDGGVTTI
jgi:NAD(P)-dependent dehydrogenase (short-subunit alcohol dehydrogenase family)